MSVARPVAKKLIQKVMREDKFDVELERRRRRNKDDRKVKRARPAAKENIRKVLGEADQ